MTRLELLAPARNAEIGIAAIDCGADAVYIAGPAFGARKDAGNPIESLRPLCDHAHKFGAKVFVTFNIAVRDDELPLMHDLMIQARDAGADAFIIRDERVTQWKDLGVPLHASTQCAIRTPERAAYYEALGCERIVLERELSIAQVRAIREAVGCEIEAFVHGALCVCYSGECRLSEKIDGRSADRGECIQACRSLYDVVGPDGKVILRDRAVLSLRDLNLIDRLEEMADAGVMSFKIEGRLKNASYVKNVVLSYSRALDALVRKYPGRYCRASFGSVSASFEPALEKTFNRGYTSLFFDGKRGPWSSMNAPKSMGEKIGMVRGLKKNGSRMEVSVEASKGVTLSNGDGFCFVRGSRIVGFRGDVCEGSRIVAKTVDSIRVGDELFRNISAAFERELEKPCLRELQVDIAVKVSGRFCITLEARCEDGRIAVSPFNADVETAENRDRAEALIREGLSKRVDHFNCRVVSFEAAGALPLLSSSIVNSMRRAVVSDLGYVSSWGDGSSPRPPVGAGSEADESSPRPPVEFGLKSDEPNLSSASPAGFGLKSDEPNLSSASPVGFGLKSDEPLMRSKYCVRFELGLCPFRQVLSAKGTAGNSGGSAQPGNAGEVAQLGNAGETARSNCAGPLYLLNNGRRFELRFDCARCEMTLW